MRRLYAPLSLVACLLLAGCQSQSAVARVEAAPVIAGAVVASAPTASTPVPSVAPCVEPGDAPEEFVMDWPSDRRADLEVALKKKTVVMNVTCSSAKVLPDCSADGTYAFIGTSEREELLSLRSADEVRANLPMSAATLTGSSGVDFQHGSSLDIAFATAGRRTSSRVTVRQSELKGECDGATHFVRAATVGAFAMGAGVGGKMRAVAEVFAAPSAGGGPIAKDGSLDACRTATAEGASEVAQCGAPIRVHLKSIKAAGAAPPVASPAAPVNADLGCPPGMVSTESGACLTPSADRPHICNFTNIPDCTAQCDKGSPTSCAILGRSYQLGRGVPQDLARATELLTKGCAAGAYSACGRLGDMVLASDEEKGLKLLDQACNGGWADGCVLAGRYLVEKVKKQLKQLEKLKKLPAKEIDVPSLFKRGCLAGQPEGCWSLGSLYADGVGGAPKNDAEAARWFALACEGDAKDGCTDYARLVDAGRGVVADPARAVALLAATCDAGHASGCGELAKDYFTAHAVARDDAKGVGLLERGCSLGDAQMCGNAGQRYSDGTGVPKDRAKGALLLAKACQAGFALACSAVKKP